VHTPPQTPCGAPVTTTHSVSPFFRVTGSGLVCGSVAQRLPGVPETLGSIPAPGNSNVSSSSLVLLF
jgi:hypothetical protein